MASTPSLRATEDETPRSARYRAQRVLWEVSNLKRLQTCGRSAASDVGVQVKVTTGADGSRSAGFGGLVTCGSWSSCPVCSEKIARRRAEEVAAAVRQWEASAPTRYVGMVTLTMRHNKGQRLTDLWDGLSYAWSKATSGRGWADENGAHGVIELHEGKGERIPWVRFVEATHGINGWHVHVHAILFLDDATMQREAYTLPVGRDFNVDDLEPFDPTPNTTIKRIGLRMFTRWQAALRRKGLDAARRHGVDARRFATGGDAVADYLTKHGVQYARPETVQALHGKAAMAPGWESAGGSHKDAKRGNRTPFGILRGIVEHGLVDDLELWHEWEAGAQGRRQVAWARGFRDWLELEAEETDEEIAAEEVGGIVVATIEPRHWNRLRHHKAELLRAAEVLPLPFLRSAPALIWLTEYRSRYRDPGINEG